MAKFGLQIDFINDILSNYFGLGKPNTEAKTLYIGLGYTQNGASMNTEDFSEIEESSIQGNYARARTVFGSAVNNTIRNTADITFPTASADWTSEKQRVSMLGIFDTQEVKDIEGKYIKPLVVLHLPREEMILSGETVIFKENSVCLKLDGMGV